MSCDIQTISISSWIIEFDPDSTRAMYRDINLDLSKADRVGLAYLRLAEEKSLSGIPFILFEKIGIDAKKASSLTKYITGDQYDVCVASYAFIGKILQGPDVWVDRGLDSECFVEFQDSDDAAIAFSNGKQEGTCEIFAWVLAPK